MLGVDRSQFKKRGVVLVGIIMRKDTPFLVIGQLEEGSVIVFQREAR